MKCLRLRFSKGGMILPAFIGGLLIIVNSGVAAEDYTNLKITEISYHPKDVINGIDTTDGDDFEFIEFKNIGETSINLTGLVLDSAVYYEFPNDVLLAPKQFWVVASKPSKFLEFYGMEPSGNFSKNLANSGDEILLQDASKNEVIHFIYDDHAPWPEEPDGDGYTLVSTFYNPTGNPGDEAYWRSSLRLNGSPFRDDGATGIDGKNAFSDVLNIYPNPANEYLVISLSDEEYPSNIKASIFNVNGTLVYQEIISNNETIYLDDKNLQSGVYIIRIETTKYIETKRLIISQPE